MHVAVRAVEHHDHFGAVHEGGRTHARRARIALQHTMISSSLDRSRIPGIEIDIDEIRRGIRAFKGERADEQRRCFGTVHLSRRTGGARSELFVAITITVDPSGIRGSLDVRKVPGKARNIVEVGRIRIEESLSVKIHEEFCKFRARREIAWTQTRLAAVKRADLQECRRRALVVRTGRDICVVRLLCSRKGNELREEKTYTR